MSDPSETHIRCVPPSCFVIAHYSDYQGELSSVLGVLRMIYVTGDTHIPINIDKLSPENFPEQSSLTKNDYVIVCGDFGLIWNHNGENETERKWKKWLDERPFTTLFVDGNHENFDRLNNYQTEVWKGGKIHRITDSIIHLMRGQVFELEGKKFFTFGGARSVDRGVVTGTEHTDRGKNWWDAELPTMAEMDEARENLALHGNKVDVIITHDLPGREQTLLAKAWRFSVWPTYLNSFLDDIRIETEYDQWYAGHYHMDIALTPKIREIFNNVINIFA
jgi:predicted phosphodiesterase